MSQTILFILLSLSVFAAYNIFILVVVGVPENISITYYDLNRKRAGLGAFFPLMICLLCLTIRPAWCSVDNIIQPESALSSYLIDITLAALFVVATISNYKKSKILFTIHYTAAIIAVITSLLWIIIADYKLMYIPITIVSLALWAAWLSHTLRHQFLFWLEITNIYSIQIVLFTLSIMSEK